MSRRRHKDAAIAVEYPLTAIAEYARLVYRQVCHDAMKPFEFSDGIGIKVTDFIIGVVCVLDLLNFTLRAYDGFAINDAAHGIQR